MPVGGSAVHECGQKVLGKARRIAAHMLKTTVENVRYEAAEFTTSQYRGRCLARQRDVGRCRAASSFRPGYPARS